MEDLHQMATISVGVGSLRQVALNILNDLLLGLTNVKLNLRSQGRSQGSEVNSELNGDIVQGDPLSFSDSKAKQQHNKTDDDDLVHQANSLEACLSGDVSKADDTQSFQPEFCLHHDIPVFMPEDDMKDSARVKVRKQLDAIFADDCVRRETFQSILETMLCAPTVQLLTDAVHRTLRVNHSVLQHWLVEDGSRVTVDPVDTAGVVKMKVDFLSNTSVFTWDKSSYGSDFLHFVTKLSSLLREANRQPTYSEFLSLHLADCILSNGGHQVRQSCKPLGSPGFRPSTQTYVTLTDPGKGHFLQSSRFAELTVGTVFKVAETEEGADAEKSDSRIAPLLNLAQVMIHVGNSAPTSYFLGTALVLPPDWKDGFIPDIDMMACAATTAFMYGAAECTICVCGLTTSQTVRYMRALRTRVNCQVDQCLTVVWYLDKIVTDDYERPEPVELSDYKHILQAALRITLIGGFDKVNLDVTDTCSSSDILSLIGFEEALMFNHEAHTKGLLTQFSTGFMDDQITNAVHSGVDVVKCRHLRVIEDTVTEDKSLQTNTVNIRGILRIRNEAAESVRGRGAHLLARLDTMFFEGSITETQNKVRIDLLQKLISKQDGAICRLLQSHSDIDQLPFCSGRPLADTARRIISSRSPMLRDVADGDYQWRCFIHRLNSLLVENDYDSLTEEFQTSPWCTFRSKHGENVNQWPPRH